MYEYFLIIATVLFQNEQLTVNLIRYSLQFIYGNLKNLMYIK